MNPHIFREYDIRGIVDRDITEDVARDIGRGFGTLIRREGGSTATIGRDCRLSSPRLAAAVVEGLRSTGCDVNVLGMTPTPVLYFNAYRFESAGALQLTGSHNPPDFNGFKMMMRDRAFYGRDIQAIRELIEADDFELGEGRVIEHDDAVSSYVDWVAEHAQMGPHAVKVVVDAGNGAAGPTVLAAFDRLGIETVPMFCDPDGNFPNHHPDPTIPENIAMLRERVLSEKADFGVGFDGDGDRIGVVDGGGQTLWGDKLMIVFSRDILRQEPGATIVGEVKCSQTLYDDITAHGGNAIMWKVGHSLIKAKMKEEKAALAGEMSGHIFFKHRFFGFDDATYAATRLAEIVSRDGEPLATHLTGVPETFVTPEIRMDVGDDAVKFRVAELVAESFASQPAEGTREIVTLDGVRAIFSDGWGLIRASNTQPVLVLRAEANSAARRDAIEADLRARVAAAESTARAELAP